MNTSNDACSNELHTTACHEAGHALVASALGARISFATIIPNGDALGCVSWKMPPDETFEALAAALESADAHARFSARMILVRHAMMAGAGLVAEGLTTGRPLWRPGHSVLWEPPPRPYPDHYLGFGDDMRNVAGALYIAARGGLASLGYQVRVERVLRRYLRARMPVVHDIAAILLREHTVDAETLGDLIGESLDRHGRSLSETDLLGVWWKPPHRRPQGRRGAA